MSELSAEVLVLIGVLRRREALPCLETELAKRHRYLKGFYQRRVFHENQTGFANKDKLDALWEALLERDWVATCPEAEQMVKALRQRIRHRTNAPLWEKKLNRSELTELKPESIPGGDHADQIAAFDLAAQMETMEEPARSILSYRLTGCDWNEAAELAGVDHPTMRRTRRALRKRFSEIGSVS